MSLNQDLVPVVLDGATPEFNLGLEANFDLAYGLGSKTDLLLNFSLQRMNAQGEFLSSTFDSMSIGLGLRKAL